MKESGHNPEHFMSWSRVALMARAPPPNFFPHRKENRNRQFIKVWIFWEGLLRRPKNVSQKNGPSAAPDVYSHFKYNKKYTYAILLILYHSYRWSLRSGFNQQNWRCEVLQSNYWQAVSKDDFLHQWVHPQLVNLRSYWFKF